MDSKKTSTAYASLDRSGPQGFLNFFERNPNLCLADTSRPKPQTTYEKDSDSLDDFLAVSYKVRFQC